MGEERRGREGLVAEAGWPVVTMTSALRCSARGSHECCSLHHAGSPCTGASAHPGTTRDPKPRNSRRSRELDHRPQDS